MRSADKGILLGMALLVLAVAFYMMVLAPKRNEASDLADQVSSLEDQIAAQEQVVAYAEQARREYPRFYGRLVVLGKAVPEQADTASLLVQLNSTARRSNVQFRGIALGTGGEGEAAAGAPAAATVASATPGTATTGTATTGTTTTTPEASASASATPATGSTTAPATTPAAAPATETAAATLPIGAAVGPAGLPTVPYDLDLKGGFFGIADYIGGLDSFVSLRDGDTRVEADGRLITVDGFAMSGGGPESNPELAAKFVVTTYVTPQQQGLTGGATPTAPQPAVSTASTVTP